MVKIMANQTARSPSKPMPATREGWNCPCSARPQACGLWHTAFECGRHLHPPSSASWWCAARHGRKGWLGRKMSHFLHPVVACHCLKSRKISPPTHVWGKGVGLAPEREPGRPWPGAAKLPTWGKAGSRSSICVCSMSGAIPSPAPPRHSPYDLARRSAALSDRYPITRGFVSDASGVSLQM